MKRLLFYSSIVSFSVLVITSCKKDENHKQIALQTNISLTSPYENQAFKKGDTIKVIGKITAPAMVHGYKVFIIKNQRDTLFAKDEHIHSMEVNISQTWVNDLSANADLQLVIIATLDHDGNTAIKKVVFKSITE